MRNLIQLLIKYYAAFLFVALQVLCLSVLVTYNHHHSIRFFSITNEITGNVNEQVSAVTDYLALKDANEKLVKQNAALRELIKESYLDTSSAFQPFSDTLYEQQFSYSEAKVISASVNKRQNFLVIDKGSKNGVKRDMGVLSPRGVAGIVTDVSPNYATVMPLLHTEMRLSTRLKRTGYFGLLSWDARSAEHVILEDIPAHVEMDKGDTLVTQGAGGMFPPGLPVGYVEEWEELDGSRFYRIKAKTATDFRKLNHVFVVKNKFSKQIKQLEGLPQINL